MVIGRPIFVVGSPRTGTTLMKDVLNGHSEVHIFNEVHFFERIWDQRGRFGDLSDPAGRTAAIEELRAAVLQYGSDPEAAEALPPEEFRKAAETHGGGYRGLLRALLEKGAELHHARHWGDSSPQDVLYLDTLAAWFPDVRIVGMARDPRAFLASYKNYYRRASTTYRERFNPLSNALLWRSYMSALLTATRGSLADSVRVTHYERLVSEPDVEIRAVCHHLGIEFEPAMLEVSGANSSYARGFGTRGIHSSSLERWREELTATEIWLVEKICARPMAELGYVPICAAQRLRPSPGQLAEILRVLPERVFNMLFRGKKPLTWNKVRRVLGFLGGRDLGH